ncbi:Phosphatidylinositol N-acetylglucosaminyltransferase GPI2 subunit [Smittium culicis]|uniref:Phosphatidylinositol N-acetylglucosaminyltransferase GPI2 subunit n=1 Tax=Smittium culicis TaxID=133412 RepID=A0A1R1XRL0_9FUNG|nr:Phosphatidylinositol N-acetylglucosaminyltransferase GPI2 subunit [Smittium culicis]OMJ17258.1 Phosphatidylinositol N-acetylglucosaminyltransferase GPI2 subunit [Smittium culicis]
MSAPPAFSHLDQPSKPINNNITPWQKKLYINQDYADDYVDKTFLIEFQKNVNVRIYVYWEVVSESIVVTQHFSSILIFIALFIYLYRESVSNYHLLYTSLIGLLIGSLIWDSIMSKHSPPQPLVLNMKMVRSVITFALILYFLSPVLRTLTKDTSSDTIWALTVVFFILNLAFHDYAANNLTRISSIGSISMNAAVLACVLLASRLSSDNAVFAFLVVALLWFALFPLLRRLLIIHSKPCSIVLTIIMVILATVAFFPISKAVSLLCFSLPFFITFLCPIWLIWIQRYKNEIHGPWDEATPIVHK